MKFRILLFLVYLICSVGSGSAEITAFTNNYTSDSDIMFNCTQVSIQFSITVDDSTNVSWFDNKVNITADFSSLNHTFIVSDTDIHEIRAETNNGTYTDVVEWIVTNKSLSNAPDFFDYFADSKYNDRSETDPWGRTLPEWTLDCGTINVSNGYLKPTYAGHLSNSSTTSHGTWKFKIQFPGGAISTSGGSSYFDYYFILGDSHKFLWSWAPDTHHYFHHEPPGGEKVSMDQDAGTAPSKYWHDITIIRTSDGWFYAYVDDLLDFRWKEETGTTSTSMRLQMTHWMHETYPNNTQHVDSFQIYSDKFLFPEGNIYYGEYIDNWYCDTDYININRSGIVIENGRNVTLSDINTFIDNASLFTYDFVTKTAVCYTDLVVGDGSELTMEDETLKFYCDYDGELQLSTLFGAILNMSNSTITSDNYYWVWRAASTTHYGYPANFAGAKWVSPNSALPYCSLQSIIINNSVINNTAYMFFNAPHELRITNTEITNLHEVDIGNYTFTGSYEPDLKARRDFMKGNKSLWFFLQRQDILDFEFDNVTISGKESPLGVTFIFNNKRAKPNVYNINLENENIVARKSVNMGSLWAGGWPTYYNNTFGVVNCKFKDILIPPEPDYWLSPHNASGVKVVPKYYLDVKVVNSGGIVEGAMVNVTNEVDDTNYPAENIHKERSIKWEWTQSYFLSLYSIFNSTTTDSNGHTPLTSDGSSSLVIADYVLDNNTGTIIQTNFTYNITVSKNEQTASMSVLDIDDTWYRTDESTLTKSISCNLDTGICQVISASWIHNPNYVYFNSIIITINRNGYRFSRTPVQTDIELPNFNVVVS